MKPAIPSRLHAGTGWKAPAPGGGCGGADTRGEPAASPAPVAVDCASASLKSPAANGGPPRWPTPLQGPSRHSGAWWNGRHERLKIVCLHRLAGSSPAAPTIPRSGHQSPIPQPEGDRSSSPSEGAPGRGLPPEPGVHPEMRLRATVSGRVSSLRRVRRMRSCHLTPAWPRAM